MKKANLLVFSILTVVLLSGTLISLAKATDDLPDTTAIPKPAQDDASSDDTVTQDSDQLYTIQDNETLPSETPTPDNLPAEDNANLLIAQANPDNTLPILAAAIVLAIVVGAIGVLFYRRKIKTEN